MKVYVIKSKQTKEYQTVVMDFIPDIRQSDIFIDYEVALAYCPSDCEVVECELMEKTELTDYTKQVRKEVCNDFKSRFLATCQIEKVCDTASFSLEVLNGILDQLQDKGEQHG